MSEAQKPVEETPAAAPATTETPAAPAEAPAATTETPAAEAPKDAPAENTEATAAAPAEGDKKDETPAEQPKEENKENKKVTPATEGQLGYKAPGLVKGLRFSKRFLYFSDDAVEAKHLNVFRQNEKPAVANATAAWASQTGKGLLFLTKRSEDKGTPAVIFNLADASEITKESSNEFLFKVNGAKHTFQAANAAERDSWFVAVEAKAAAAKSEKEAITGSEGYKAEHEKLKNPAAAAAAAKKPAEKTEEPAENKEEAKKDDKKEEAAAPAEENKEAKDKSAKSRSQSRKRTSLFGTLLGKKEETEEKKDEKAEESKPAEAKEETPAESSKAAEAPAEAAPAPEAAEKKEENKEEQKEEPKEEAKEEKKEEKKDEQKEEKKTETPAKSKRASLFGGFFQKVSSPSQEKTEKEATAPAAESSAVASTAPQLDNPVEGAAGKPLEPESVTAPAEGEAAKDTSAAQSPAAETPGASKEVKDKRRTSFFGNFGKKKGESSDTEDAESKKGNKLGGLFRKPSKAVKLDNQKETAADAEDKTENKPEPVAKDAPAEEKPAQEEAKPAEAPAATEESKTNNVTSSTPVQAAA